MAIGSVVLRSYSGAREGTAENCASREEVVEAPAEKVRFNRSDPCSEWQTSVLMVVIPYPSIISPRPDPPSEVEFLKVEVDKSYSPRKLSMTEIIPWPRFVSISSPASTNGLRSSLRLITLLSCWNSKLHTDVKDGHVPAMEPFVR